MLEGTGRLIEEVVGCCIPFRLILLEYFPTFREQGP